ncbi:DEAD/DEAH box helicase [Ktedonobacter racemifer]|uniref:SNF2-related protein n=1 Tax=Ktedonobacter racemifer DSM 44963 TaxID=485913 RepID=D6THH4_KTERA|nr:DEAD/DEAH box helicase [Ktedonobacter racemifer]EFH88979.1 SNF2-related protein [Ktedonobacter racemifer DSM 44963]
MSVLHATWQTVEEGKLFLWGERAQLRSEVEATNSDAAPLHPFCLSTQELRAQFEMILSQSGSLEASDDVMAVRLPSTSKYPLPSPRLVLETPITSKSKPQLRDWSVEALSLDDSHACDMLLALPEQPPASGEYHSYGSDLRFWMKAAQLALELVQRQSFLPSLKIPEPARASSRGGSKQAVKMKAAASWSLALMPEDQERVARLARAMPPACRAFRVAGTIQPVEIDPQELLLNFLQRSVDALVRTSMEKMEDQGRLPRGMSLSAQWVQALASSHGGELAASKEDLQAFTDAVVTWLRPVVTRAEFRPFRTCFRLEQPGREQTDDQEAQEGEADQAVASWKLSFHLQANDDPSLLVSAEQVWQARAGSSTFLNRAFQHPQESLLTDLGVAIRLFPPLERGLRSARPTEVTLSTEEAYHFLSDAAPLLKQSGFGVLVPSWWGSRGARLAAKLHVKGKESTAKESSGFLTLDSLLQYNWQMSLGGEVLSEQEFLELVSLKQPLVKVRGQWIELRPEELEAASEFFAKKLMRKEELSLRDLLRLEAGAEEQQSFGVSHVEVEVEGWLDDTLKRLQGKEQLEVVEIPTTFQGQLRPYQVRGVSWMTFLKRLSLGACLADDMGLGKTASLIGLLLYERAHLPQGARALPTLVICPMSIVGNWQREVQRFAPSLSVHVHHGAERLSGEEFVQEVRQHDVVLTTYALALRDQELLNQVAWENIVLDEAQNIKNDEAKQTQAIKKLKSRYRLALTGTPVENRLSELRSIVEFLNPGYLGSAQDFRQRFVLPIERYHDTERSQVLKQLVQPFILRRVKTDKSIIQDLPEKMEMKVLCNLTQEQASLYDAVVKEMLEKIDDAKGIERKGMILSALLRLKQVCNHPAHFMGDESALGKRSGKVLRLEEMLEEVLAEGDKALIFTQFAEMGQLLRRHLQEQLGREVLFLHGGTPKKVRDQLVTRFQDERDDAPLFLLSLKAGGVGLNLTAANHVFHFDRWWNPAVENQATDRAFRIGQHRNVQVHKFVCVGTLEERIDAMIESKKALAENIIGSGENWLTEMSTSQLRELFVLGREAVGE